jgi:hypothetical protein
MAQIRVIIAHSLATYASTLAGILRETRPAFIIEHVEPSELDERVTGALVISDNLSPAVRAKAGTAILFYPDQANVAVILNAGKARAIVDPAWDDLLAAIDSAALGISDHA